MLAGNSSRVDDEQEEDTRRTAVGVIRIRIEFDVLY